MTLCHVCYRSVADKTGSQAPFAIAARLLVDRFANVVRGAGRRLWRKQRLRVGTGWTLLAFCLSAALHAPPDDAVPQAFGKGVAERWIAETRGVGRAVMKPHLDQGRRQLLPPG